VQWCLWQLAPYTYAERRPNVAMEKKHKLVLLTEWLHPCGLSCFCFCYNCCCVLIAVSAGLPKRVQLWLPQAPQPS
jgi:hypothetical protein